MSAKHKELILILDFGSQYTQLIARRVRELNVYSEIKPYHFSIDQIQELNPKGIILSGGPSSVYEPNAPLVSKKLFEFQIPTLGICYGLQLMSYLLGGKVARAESREYGQAELLMDTGSQIFQGLGTKTVVWMSHGDRLIDLPHGFEVIGHTANSPFAAIQHSEKPFYGLQFHPEVIHTPQGITMLQNFVYRVCGCHGLWTSRSFIENSVSEIKEKIGKNRAICALSGGVDSSVAAILVHRAIGDKLTCVFVDNGLLRSDEGQEVKKVFQNYFRVNFRYVDASADFIAKLNGVVDPEQKRKIIGEEFIRIFEGVAREIGKVEYLIQGTLYPDVIESVSTKGPSATIKTHHNVGGLPAQMHLKLVEPLRELFKDEVRKVGQELGLPVEILGRHPFPGPGMAVRVLGEVTEERLAILRRADKIYLEELKRANWYDQVWQAFAVLLPVQTVGVMGDERTYESVIALRAVTSRDGMTADWAKLPHALLGKVANRIINEVKGVNRVVYDISSKPPSTIEWE